MKRKYPFHPTANRNNEIKNETRYTNLSSYDADESPMIFTQPEIDFDEENNFEERQRKRRKIDRSSSSGSSDNNNNNIPIVKNISNVIGYKKKALSNSFYPFEVLPQKKSFNLRYERMNLPLKIRPTKNDARLIDHSEFSSEDFTWSENLRRFAKGVFGISRFRPFQKEAMNAFLGKRDVFLILPTGEGKSLCFQLPGILNRTGITLVISPLISLIQDQVFYLQSKRVKCSYLSGSNYSNNEEMRRITNECGSESEFLFVTPERLSKSMKFRDFLGGIHRRNLLNSFVIDEAHCVSTWGHDFRGEYRNLSELRKNYPEIPIIALTATATQKVREDVKMVLRIRNSCEEFIGDFNRPNLRYVVYKKPKKDQMVNDIVRFIFDLKYRHQSGIVYCLSKRDCEEVSNGLNSNGLKSVFYHSGLSDIQKQKLHKNWKNDIVQIIVATIAFGMGIDKPDVRFVIHTSMSKSLEGYYQESGRAGRDGSVAHCLLFFDSYDKIRLFRLLNSRRSGFVRNYQNLYDVEKYCINEYECRHFILIRNFDPNIAREDVICNNSCDNCMKRSKENSLSPKNFELNSLLEDVALISSRIGFSKTMKFLVSYLYGFTNRDCAEFKKKSRPDIQKLHGKHRKFENIGNLSRSVLELIHLGFLDEKVIVSSNPMSKSWTYIGKGERSSGRARIRLTIRKVNKKLRFNELEDELGEDDVRLKVRLQKFRKDLSKSLKLPQFLVFSDYALENILKKKPKSVFELVNVSGFSKDRICRFPEIAKNVIKVTSRISKNLDLDDNSIMVDIEKLEKSQLPQREEIRNWDIVRNRNNSKNQQIQRPPSPIPVELIEENEKVEKPVPVISKVENLLVDEESDDDDDDIFKMMEI